MASPHPDPSKPHSRYRQKGRANLVVLPADGCDLPAPDLPPGREWSDTERKVWAELWRSPQASQWDDSFAPLAAMFVVYHLAVLSGEATAWMAQEARHLADRLGLSPAGLIACGWRLADPGEGGLRSVGAS